MAICNDEAPHITPPNPPAPSGGGGVTIVNAIPDEFSGGSCFDKTAGELWQAVQNGVVLIKSGDGQGIETVGIVAAAVSTDEGYTFYDASGSDYIASTADDYPCFTFH